MGGCGWGDVDEGREEVTGERGRNRNRDEKGELKIANETSVPCKMACRC